MRFAGCPYCLQPARPKRYLGWSGAKPRSKMATKKQTKTTDNGLKSQQQAHIVERILQEHGPQTVAQIVAKSGLSAKRVQRHLDYCCNEMEAQKRGTIPKLKALRVSHSKNGVYRLTGDGRGEDGAGAFRTEDWQKQADSNAKLLVKAMKAAGAAVATTAKRVAAAKRKAKK